MTGPLKLRQRSPITISSTTQKFYQEDLAKKLLAEDFQELMLDYGERNQTTYYDAQRILMPTSSTAETTIELKIEIPTSQAVQ